MHYYWQDADMAHCVAASLLQSSVIRLRMMSMHLPSCAVCVCAKRGMR